MNISDFAQEYNNIDNLEKEYNQIITDKKISLYNNILNFEFPQGKYAGKKINDVILSDYQYCVWWFTKNNVPAITANDILYYAKSRAEHIRNAEWRKKEDEYEARRMEWCKRNGENYQLDYDIRHNINLRDWGM